MSEKARRRIAHPSPHDTASGAVWDGSVVQKASNDRWDESKQDETRQPIYGNNQTRPNNSHILRVPRACYHSMYFIAQWVVLIVSGINRNVIESICLIILITSAVLLNYSYSISYGSQCGSDKLNYAAAPLNTCKFLVHIIVLANILIIPSTSGLFFFCVNAICSHKNMP